MDFRVRRAAASDSRYRKSSQKKKRRTKPKMEDEESGEKRRLENRAVSGSLRLCKDRTQFKIVACHFHWRLKDEVDG